MKLLTCRYDGEIRPAVLRGDDVVDLSPVAATVLALIDAGSDALLAAQERAEQAPALARREDVELLAPIPEPRGQLYCVGWNYLKHFNEGVGRRGDQEVELPAHPTFFSKPAGTVIGPEEPVAWCERITEKLDYEAELVVVIGRGGRSIPERTALSHVFGYTLANDISAREIQRRHGGQWLKGKGMDTYCPLGPVLVTVDEIPDPQQLMIRGTVNGELRQQAQLTSMIFPIARLIAELSLGMTLRPGDLLLTGTPDGVGFGRSPQVFLQPGDVCEVTVEQLGTLRNPVAELNLA